jgi:hypothetical protein
MADQRHPSLPHPEGAKSSARHRVPAYSTSTLIIGSRVALTEEQLAMAKVSDPVPRSYPDPVFFELFARCFPNMAPSHLVLLLEPGGGDGRAADGDGVWWVGIVLDFMDLETGCRVEALSYETEQETVLRELHAFETLYPESLLPHPRASPNPADRFTPHCIFWARRDD